MYLCLLFLDANSSAIFQPLSFFDDPDMSSFDLFDTGDLPDLSGSSGNLPAAGHLPELNSNTNTNTNTMMPNINSQESQVSFFI